MTKKIGFKCNFCGSFVAHVSNKITGVLWGEKNLTPVHPDKSENHICDICGRYHLGASKIGIDQDG